MPSSTACSTWRPSAVWRSTSTATRAATWARAPCRTSRAPSSGGGSRDAWSCGHCCSLAVQPRRRHRGDRSIWWWRRASPWSSLPMCNLYLQDRVPGRTPRWRGVTLLHEMKARGIPVAVASDNCRDAVPRLSAITTCSRSSARPLASAHLDRPYGDWPRAVTTTPADPDGPGRRRAHRCRPARRPRALQGSRLQRIAVPAAGGPGDTPAMAGPSRRTFRTTASSTTWSARGATEGQGRGRGVSACRTAWTSPGPCPRPG